MIDSKITNLVWNDKYRYGAEETPAASMARVVKGVYANDTGFASQALNSMLALDWCPGGRIHAGAGTPKRVTWINCYVSPDIDDSMEGIMDALKVAALTQQQGGGIGMNFSTLRPAGAIVHRTGSVSSGVIHFMEMWNGMCGAIKSSGSRRGAMMATLADWHPDVERFIKAKHEKGKLTNFNVSVMVSDAFMRAVKEDGEWELGFPVPPADGSYTRLKSGSIARKLDWYVYKVVKARELWESMIRSTYEYAEPGVLFIDTVNKWNNLYYCETISCTNPCFTGDTKVWTIEGPRRFDEMVGMKSVDVLTQLSDGHLAYRPMINPRRTGLQAKLVQVTLQGTGRRIGGQTTTLRCTPGHEFYLSDGRVEYASKLICGDRIISAYRRKNRKNYIRLSVTGGETTMEHHLAIELKYGRRPVYPLEHGHHLEDGKEVNLPHNVEIKDAHDHNSEHILGDLNPMRRFPEKNYFKGRPLVKEQNGRWRDDVSTKEIQRLRKAGLSFKAIAMKVGCSKYTARQRALGLVRAHAATANHIVLSVEKLSEREDVYCGTVPSTGRFFTVDARDEVNWDGVLVSNCGEQPLPPNGDCNLGAVNLAMMVDHPFEHKKARIDFRHIDKIVEIGMRFLDNVLDLSPFPTEEQKAEALAKRRTGLGITGLGNMLQQMMVRYGSPLSVEITSEVMQHIAHQAYRTSIQLAKERGSFPMLDKDLFLASKFVRTLPDDIRDGIREHGIRNGVLLTIAPTGTTSIYYGNISSGLEPTFAWKYDRKVLMPDNSLKSFEVQDYGYKMFMEHFPEHPMNLKGYESDKTGRLRDPLPPYMVTANELTVDDHLAIQAACQKYVDASISKTINCPKSMPFDEFQAVYTKAYSLGLKGCTTYRPSDVRGSILSVKEVSTPQQVTSRPAKLTGSTYKLRWPGLDQAFYITINDIEREGKPWPFEIFINSKSVKHQEWITALTRMMSAVFRKSDNPTFMIEELEQVYSPTGGQFMNGKYVPSLVGLIARTMKQHFEEIGLMSADTGTEDDSIPRPVVDAIKNMLGEICPQCNQPTLYHKEGCSSCQCGYSNCG